MSFSSLSSITQDVLMIQFEFFGKLFLIGFFFCLAIFCVAYWRKRQKDTPYVLVALIRTWLYFISWIYIYFTPLFIVFLYPQVSIDAVLKLVFMFYRYATLMIGLVLFINLLFYAPLVLGKLGGLDIQSKNTNKILDDFLGKYKKYFRR